MALIRAWASIIAGLAAATKPVCALRSAPYCCHAGPRASSRSCAAEPRLLMLSSMFLTVSLSAATTVLSAPSSMISPSFSSRDLLGFLHFLGALVQRLLAPRSQQVRSLTGEARALGGKLQAGGKPGNVPAAEIDHGPAEMPEHQAGAGADDDRHAGDHGEGGKQAASDAPMETQKAKDAGSVPGFPVNGSCRHAPCPALLCIPGSAVGRQYRVTRLIKSGALQRFTQFWAAKTKGSAQGRPFRSLDQS